MTEEQITQVLADLNLLQYIMENQQTEIQVLSVLCGIVLAGIVGIIISRWFVS